MLAATDRTGSTPKKDPGTRLGPPSGEASLMRVVMLFRNERRRCESDAHGGGGSGGTPPENFEI